MAALTNDVFVADASVVTALGKSMDALWPHLCSGESAVRAIGRFETGRLNCHDAACIDGPSAGGHGNVVCELAGSALDGLGACPRETFVIWTGIKGNAQFIEHRTQGIDAPERYLPLHYRQWICRRLGLADAGMEVNAACASSTVGLAIGAQMISEGRASSVLVAGADMVSRFIFTGFSSLRALSASRCRPFDENRDGLCLGDGAAAMLLVNGEAAVKSGCAPKARLTGWGIANDATHITGPARDGRGLVNSIRSALAQAGISPGRVEAFCAHGTGTSYNDAMEMTALETIFGSRRFPLFSIKGAIGHTLGAAGAIEAAVSMRSLAEKKTPPTAGLQRPEARAMGRATGSEQPFAGNNILTTNSGFGGCNAALLFERV